MNDSQGREVSNSTAGRDEVSLLDFLLALAKHKRILVKAPLAVAIIAGAVSFAIPNVYMASTTMLPPQQAQSTAAALLSQLGGVAGDVAGSAGFKNPNDLYIGMLKSNSVADKLIAKFDLKRVYDTESLEEARKALQKKSKITSGKDNFITIAVEDKDPKRVAPLANAYVAELIELTKVLAVTDAAKSRAFYERELKKTKDNLAEAEMALKKGLDTHGVVSVDSESRAIVETVSRLRAQVSAKEIQLNSMSAFVTTNNPDYKKVQQELASLKAELSKLENGRTKESLGEQPTNDTSPSGLANIKLLRDVKYYQMLYELLAKQYEFARMDEAKDPAIIQVLDPAAEPENKYSPKRALIVFAAFFLTLITTMAWAIAREGVFSDGSQKNSEKWMRLKQHLRA